MQINFKRLNEEKIEYISEWDGKEIEINGEMLQFCNPANFEGTLYKKENSLEIEGRVTARLKMHCHRCGEEVMKEIIFDVQETFRREPESDEEFSIISDEINFDEMLECNLRLNAPIKV